MPDVRMPDVRKQMFVGQKIVQDKDRTWIMFVRTNVRNGKRSYGIKFVQTKDRTG